MNNHYVYAYFSEESCDPFYIGKGTKRRAYQHLEPQNLQLQDRFHCTLRSLIQRGIKIEIQFLLTEATAYQAMLYEMKLIKRFGKFNEGGCLTNHTDGGPGRLGIKHSEETKLKIRMARAKQIIPPSTRRKPVRCLLDGIPLKSYESTYAVEKDGYDQSTVLDVLKGRMKTAYGFEWEYLHTD